MQRNNTTRNAVLPPGEFAARNRFQAMRNEHILLRHLGQTHAQIAALDAIAQAQAVDSLVLFCRQNGITAIMDHPQWDPSGIPA